MNHLLVEETRVLSVLVDIGVSLFREGEGVAVAGARHDHVGLKRRAVAEDGRVLFVAATQYERTQNVGRQSEKALVKTTNTHRDNHTTYEKYIKEIQKVNRWYLVIAVTIVYDER